MPALNKFSPHVGKTAQGLNHPAEHAEAVTPSDSADLAVVSRSLWVGGAGNVSVIMLSGVTVTFSGVAAGTMLPIRVSRVRATGTSASLLVSIS